MNIYLDSITRDESEPMILLVDSHHGIYCWHILATNYADSLYIDREGGCYDLFSDTITDIDETIETVFHPDNAEWCENINWYQYELCIRHSSGEYWRIAQIEGDIWAIHPHATWDEDADTWVINEG